MITSHGIAKPPALETKFADEEKQRQEKIEAEREKLKNLENQRLEVLRKKEQEKRLTIMRQREEQALRMEQVCNPYEEADQLILMFMQ